MQFEDDGYIINLRKHGENSLILTVLSQNHGKVTGYVKNCLHKKNLALFQLGNHVHVDAYSRVDENMLSLKVELLEASSVNFFSDIQKIACLSSFCELSNATMPELFPLESFFNTINNFFNFINEDNWIYYYCCFEFYLLDMLGIGLDLSECAATQRTDNLAYVSPKSGKAVCEEAGNLYKDKLFLYPHFIIHENTHPNKEEVKALLQMTEFFLNKNFFRTHGLKFPQNRDNLLSQLEL